MPHLVINGYFADQPTTGTGRYTRALAAELPGVWDGPISVLIPRWMNSGALARECPNVSVVPLSVPLKGSLGKVWFEQIAVPMAARRMKADVLHIP
ncbi:MAG: glycosyltransferase family 1 protein, partial [Dehalococcoidia bacterium]|nr:glycosyltransferase family 1 protein [Dehalococcoidia bacterium]